MMAVRYPMLWIMRNGSIYWKEAMILTHYQRIYEITGAFCWYNHDSAAHENEYGKLYNFGAAESGKLCPTGWHVPTNEEWWILCTPIFDNPDNPEYNGVKLMETGTAHWISTNTYATNERGFTTLPGGSRSSSFNEIGTHAYFWSSNRVGEDYGAISLYRPIPYHPDFAPSPLGSGKSMTNGLSIRCIKD